MNRLGGRVLLDRGLRERGRSHGLLQKVPVSLQFRLGDAVGWGVMEFGLEPGCDYLPRQLRRRCSVQHVAGGDADADWLLTRLRLQDKDGRVFGVETSFCFRLDALPVPGCVRSSRGCGIGLREQ